MKFLKENRRFDFLYGKKPLDECDFSVSVEEKGNEITTVYTFNDGLKVTNIAKKIDKFGAYEWVNWFENTGNKSTEIISDIWDACFSVPLEYEHPLHRSMCTSTAHWQCGHELPLHLPHEASSRS